MTEPLYLAPGNRVRMELPFSEVCMHMQVAGKVMTVELLDREYPMAQLFHDNGHEFSAPITCGEAGFYWDCQTRSYYCYPACEFCANIDKMTGRHHCPVHAEGAAAPKEALCQ